MLLHYEDYMPIYALLIGSSLIGTLVIFGALGKEALAKDGPSLWSVRVMVQWHFLGSAVVTNGN